jgi:hypothetical protein
MNATPRGQRRCLYADAVHNIESSTRNLKWNDPGRVRPVNHEERAVLTRRLTQNIQILKCLHFTEPSLEERRCGPVATEPSDA